jgi:5-(carboxyamino)imidazole ribonucleotide mutase
VSIGGARNAGLLAVRMLAASDAALLARMREFQESLRALVIEKDAALSASLAASRRASGAPA